MHPTPPLFSPAWTVIALTVLALSGTAVQAAPGDAYVRWLDQRGAGIDQRWDRRGDWADARLDRRSDWAAERGRSQLSQYLDRRGDRLDRHWDRAGDRVDRRLDWRSQHLPRSH